MWGSYKDLPKQKQKQEPRKENFVGKRPSLQDGYEFDTPGNLAHAPGKAALGRRTCTDILHHLTTHDTLPPREFSIYRSTLLQDFADPSAGPSPAARMAVRIRLRRRHVESRTGDPGRG